MREQFLVEITDTTSEDLAAAGVDHATALLELNRLFMAWTETEYHRRVHTETGQPPLDRWEAGWERAGRAAAIPSADDLTEAFLWSEYRVVTKTATVSLHANTYQVDAALVGRKVELVFSPFDLEVVEVRYHDKSFGKALPHNISRHSHPKAKPETPELDSPPATGIDYLNLTADAHHEQLRRRTRPGIGWSSSNSRTPAATVSGCTPPATATSLIPPRPSTLASAPSNNRHARSSKCGRINDKRAATESESTAASIIPQVSTNQTEKPN